MDKLQTDKQITEIDKQKADRQADTQRWTDTKYKKIVSL